MGDEVVAIYSKGMAFLIWKCVSMKNFENSSKLSTYGDG